MIQEHKGRKEEAGSGREMRQGPRSIFGPQSFSKRKAPNAQQASSYFFFAVGQQEKWGLDKTQLGTFPAQQHPGPSLINFLWLQCSLVGFLPPRGGCRLPSRRMHLAALALGSCVPGMTARRRRRRKQNKGEGERHFAAGGCICGGRMYTNGKQ